MTKLSKLKDDFISIFENNKNRLFGNKIMDKYREDALNSFQIQGFPSGSKENWKNSKIEQILTREKFFHQLSYPFVNINSAIDFSCEIENLDSYDIIITNGWFPNNDGAMKRLDCGVMIGSLNQAAVEFPQIFEKYYNRAVDYKNNSFAAINTAFAQEGIFVYIPENTKLNKPIQIINVINTEANLFIQPRNLIVTEKNSEATVLICDHSLTDSHPFVNSLTEIFAGENSKLRIYNSQNQRNSSAQNLTIFINQKKYSSVINNTITLHGGYIRNNIISNLDEENSNIDLYGIYLADKKQQIDNNTVINHNVPNCTSNELYKGVIDEDSHGIFRGKVLVKKDAQQTDSNQINKNLLLTKTAKVNTNPQLEIYADDVKCSHGATIGQLEETQLFYLKTRGISEKEARSMLMTAFTYELIDKIHIQSLRESIGDLVEKRLKGELTRCDSCALACHK